MNEEEIKRRLVGSVVVVLSIVIFVPILLDSSKRDTDQINTLEVPSSSELSLQSISDDKTSEFSSEKSEQTQIPSVSGERDTTITSKNSEREGFDGVIDEILEERKARNKVDSFEISLKELESKIGGLLKTESDIEKKPLGLVEWLLQVGSFSDKKNAEDFASRLKKGLFEAYTVDIGDDSGKFYKVRIGPYNKRVEAQNDLVKIEKSYGVKGFLVKVTP